MVNVYEIVTEKISDALRAGTVPWRKPWRSTGGELPYNGITGRRYSGINVFLLALNGYSDPRYVTYNQAKKTGGTVKRGERGTLVVYWNFIDRKNPDTGEIEQVPLLRYYTVFNAEQVENVRMKVRVVNESTATVDPIEAGETLVANWADRPEIRTNGTAAYYTPATDVITVPPRDTFESSESYYSTLFHEMAHSTGHKSRLNRFVNGSASPFGCADYSREELVAEFGNAFLCANAGIENQLEQSASYIDSWLKALAKDSHALVWAASRAQAAADLILGHNGDSETVDVAETA